MSRPSGVRHRIVGLISEQWDIMLARPELRLRVELDSLLTFCGRLHYSDVAVVQVLDTFRRVVTLTQDATQLRTGSGFERSGLRCVDELSRELGDLHDVVPAELAVVDQERFVEPLLRIPPPILLGDGVDVDAHFHLVCWNVACSAIEDVRTPYLAARAIAGMGFHDPIDEYGVVGPMERLAVRFEDEAEARPAVAEQIRAELDAYATRAPFRALRE